MLEPRKTRGSKRPQQEKLVESAKGPLTSGNQEAYEEIDQTQRSLSTLLNTDKAELEDESDKEDVEEKEAYDGGNKVDDAKE